jgi:hypothetical protein
MNNKGQGGNFQKQSQFWVPEVGKYSIRIVPWPSEVESDTRPFIEKWFYYELGKKIIAPPLSQPDPIRELRDALYSDRTEQNLALAKKLKPKLRAFLPIIVRGSEGEETPKIWSIGQETYKAFLGYLVDPDWGDVTDLSQGRDFTVTISNSGKKMADGTVVKDITLVVSPKVTPLFEDGAKLKHALNNVPNIETIYPSLSYQDLANALERYIDGPPTGQQVVKGGNMTSGGRSSSDKPQKQNLDDAFDDLLNGD